MSKFLKKSLKIPAPDYINGQICFDRYQSGVLSQRCHGLAHAPKCTNMGTPIITHIYRNIDTIKMSPCSCMELMHVIAFPLNHIIRNMPWGCEVKQGIHSCGKSCSGLYVICQKWSEGFYQSRISSLLHFMVSFMNILTFIIFLLIAIFLRKTT